MKKCKKINSLIIAAMSFSFLIFSFGIVQAANLPAFSGGKPAVQGNNAGATEMTRKRKPYTMEEKIQILHGKYDINESEARGLLKENIPFRDLDRICLWSVIVRRPASYVLSLKKNHPWDRVMVLLKVTPQQYHDRNLALRAHQMHSWWGFDESISYRAMADGYPMHYVKIAWILAKHTGKAMDFFLQDRKSSEPWTVYCARTLKISEDTYKEWIGEYRNPTWIPGKG